MIVDDDKVIFSSGKEISVNGGVIGINEHLDIHGGYDNGIPLQEFDDDQNEILLFTKEERQELASYMIELWKEFGALEDAEVFAMADETEEDAEGEEE